MFNNNLMDFLEHLKIGGQNAGLSTGAKWIESSGAVIDSFSPVDGKKIASVIGADRPGYEAVVETAASAFKEWSKWPAPRRGEIVRQVAEALRAKKDMLGKL